MLNWSISALLAEIRRDGPGQQVEIQITSIVSRLPIETYRLPFYFVLDLPLAIERFLC